MITIDLGIQHHFSSGVYAKQMHLPTGNTALSHKHAFDHMSILAMGIAVVVVDGKETVYTAPTCVEIKAGLEHSITALSDVVWFCIHATDEQDISKIDEIVIQKEGV